MGIEKHQKRYLSYSDRFRSCQSKVAFPDKRDAAEAAETTRVHSMSAYKCRHCPFWHIGKSMNIKQSLEPRVECPNGCGRQIRSRRLDNHIGRCSPEEI